jgi:hypothetical protein
MRRMLCGRLPHVNPQADRVHDPRYEFNDDIVPLERGAYRVTLVQEAMRR